MKRILFILRDEPAAGVGAGGDFCRNEGTNSEALTFSVDSLLAMAEASHESGVCPDMAGADLDAGDGALAHLLDFDGGEAARRDCGDHEEVE